MKIKKLLRNVITVTALFVFVVASVRNMPLAHATGSTVGAPDQAGCTSGSTNFTWNGMNIARPVIASMSVDGETIADPTNPVDGSLGAAICPNVELGRRTGLYVYMKNGSSNDMDLTNAVTPIGSHPLTVNSLITITINNFGDLAPYFSFALVHGNVTNYATTNLGLANATMTITMKPVRTPFGSGEEFGGCTATPPHCDAPASQADAFSASMDITFDQTGYGSQFRGAYFALVGAMGGWVEAVGGGSGPHSLLASVGGPHFLADGTTPNVGSLKAFVPDAAVVDLFNTTSDQLTTENMEVTRTEGDTTEPAPFTVSQVSGGILVTMDNVTFSSPAYNIGLLGQLGSGGGGEGAPEDSNTSRSLPSGDSGFVNLHSDDGTVITSFTASAESSLAVADPGYKYPLGLHSFTMNVPNGSTQNITLNYITDLKPSEVTVRKYNATTHAYTTLTGVTMQEDMFGGHHVLSVSYQITDNGALDQDSVLGTITDPVGLGQVQVSVPNTGLR